MRRWSTVGLMLVSLGMLAGDALADRSPPDGLLETFRKEFIPVTPGAGKFPARIVLGSGQAARTLAPSEPFEIARFEVPQNLYEAVMGTNPSRWKGPRNSVEMIDWDDAIAFCDKAATLLRQRKLIAEDCVIRLPSEVEWEYVCRAGTQTAYSFGDDENALGEYAWFHGNAAGNDPPVGAKKPNPWGLFDIHGYLWEWCDDRQPLESPGRASGPANSRVVRGGAWTSAAQECRSDSRRVIPRGSKGADIGFRCVLARQTTGPRP